MVIIIKVDLTKKRGEFKPVNGIGNGPVCFGECLDSSSFFKMAGFPYCRLHDVNWPNAREVDVHTIFRNFDADPDDPANYFFETTDKYINSIIAVGAKIIYRLGCAIEHTKVKYYVHPPKDFGKWAKVCLNIARHYNEGWADGFRMGIEYWEVWNEPDQLTEDRACDPMWSGTPQQYYDLYAAAARLFKEEMPYVKIGGYAGCGPYPQNRFEFFTNFLQYVKDNGLALDFYSWHMYTTDISDIRERAHLVRDTLDKFGFTETESIFDEWNYVAPGSGLWPDMFGDESGVLPFRKVYSETKGLAGASFTAAALIEMSDLPIDIAAYYDSLPYSWYGVFDVYGVPEKSFYPFVAFNMLKECGERVELTCGYDNIYALASASENTVGIMAVNFEGRTNSYKYEISGLDPEGVYLYELYLLDDDFDMEKACEITCKPGGQPDGAHKSDKSYELQILDKAREKTRELRELPDSVYLHNNSAVFIKITRQ